MDKVDEMLMDKECWKSLDFEDFADSFVNYANKLFSETPSLPKGKYEPLPREYNLMLLDGPDLDRWVEFVYKATDGTEYHPLINIPTEDNKKAMSFSFRVCPNGKMELLSSDGKWLTEQTAAYIYEHRIKNDSVWGLCEALGFFFGMPPYTLDIKAVFSTLDDNEEIMELYEKTKDIVDIRILYLEKEDKIVVELVPKDENYQGSMVSKTKDGFILYRIMVVDSELIPEEVKTYKTKDELLPIMNLVMNHKRDNLFGYALPLSDKICVTIPFPFDKKDMKFYYLDKERDLTNKEEKYLDDIFAQLNKDVKSMTEQTLEMLSEAFKEEEK